jgi:dGTP triphosphohydrolase
LRECKKLISRHHLKIEQGRKDRARFRKRTGNQPQGPQSLEPKHWNLHPHFNPFKVRKRADVLSYTIAAKIRKNLYEPEPALAVEIPKPHGGSSQRQNTDTIAALVKQAAKKFLEIEKACLEGEFDDEIVSLIPAAPALDNIRKITVEKIYPYPRVVEIETAGFEVLGGLLDSFVGAAFDVARAQKKQREPTTRSKKLMQLVPEQFLDQKTPHQDAYECLLCMIDFVCGMTDSYAVSL